MPTDSPIQPANSSSSCSSNRSPLISMAGIWAAFMVCRHTLYIASQAIEHHQGLVELLRLQKPLMLTLVECFGYLLVITASVVRCSKLLVIGCILAIIASIVGRSWGLVASGWKGDAGMITHAWQIVSLLTDVLLPAMVVFFTCCCCCCRRK